MIIWHYSIRQPKSDLRFASYYEKLIAKTVIVYTAVINNLDFSEAQWFVSPPPPAQTNKSRVRLSFHKLIQPFESHSQSITKAYKLYSILARSCI